MRNPFSPKLPALILATGLAATIAFSSASVSAAGCCNSKSKASCSSKMKMKSHKRAMAHHHRMAMNSTATTPRKGTVLGVATEMSPNRLTLSLRSNGIKSFVPETLTAGYTTITVVNAGMTSRGVIIKSRDVIGTSLTRYTPILRPGHSLTFGLYLGSGTFTAMEYHSFTRPMRHWRSHFQTSFSIAP